MLGTYIWFSSLRIESGSYARNYDTHITWLDALLLLSRDLHTSSIGTGSPYPRGYTGFTRADTRTGSDGFTRVTLGYDSYQSPSKWKHNTAGGEAAGTMGVGRGYPWQLPWPVKWVFLELTEQVTMPNGTHL
ncbi:hypothetical protein GGX14DRAFT_391078 [Mycena pura]|uniref:Uncharacterized protein n=1 Tax=Mycena pura TaxID=153505 RepID=A0AAD6VRD5_9AGAR|nr:hypothetical protein GGX14DRAFT_407108 [Mycena pura]KAJ7217273.1 hypothetical protein GGX14DRAFT_391078 [Mycena pura]